MSDYRIIKEIGHGGMGCVYKAEDANGRTVALKMLSNKVTCYPEYRELFQAEVDTLRQMDHPSVVHILGEPYSDSSGNYYLPMEFVEGQTLEQIVRQQGPFPYQYAIELMCKILDAMQYVHDQRRIHRDIKPSNIMLRPDGTVCIIDFGIAKDAKIGGTGHTVGRIIGTDGYMSPEQAYGLNIDLRTDIYSLGCVFFFIVTGQNMIQKGSSDFDTIDAIIHGKVPIPSQINPSIPQAVDQVFFKAVDKDMRKRYQSAAAFREALLAVDANTVPTVTVGRDADNDIQINNQYVSRRHLVIRGCEEEIPSGVRYYLEITNNGTNGTGVDGRPLKGTMNVPYESSDMLPLVLLAARIECKLPWDRVVTLLRSRGWNPPDALSAPQPDYSQQQSATVSEDATIANSATTQSVSGNVPEKETGNGLTKTLLIILFVLVFAFIVGIIVVISKLNNRNENNWGYDLVSEEAASEDYPYAEPMDEPVLGSDYYYVEPTDSTQGYWTNGRDI